MKTEMVKQADADERKFTLLNECDSANDFGKQLSIFVWIYREPITHTEYSYGRDLVASHSQNPGTLIVGIDMEGTRASDNEYRCERVADAGAYFIVLADAIIVGDAAANGYKHFRKHIIIQRHLRYRNIVTYTDTGAGYSQTGISQRGISQFPGVRREILQFVKMTIRKAVGKVAGKHR